MVCTNRMSNIPPSHTLAAWTACADLIDLVDVGLTAEKSCMPMTAKMKMMMQRTKVRLARAPNVFIMIVRMSFRDFQLLASLNTLDIR